ncbi:hypothetical protein D1P53_000896 [Cryptococcus gattii VGV]|nr:hypothetical protein D1P53_000896 [Cryptococcus gattii VGV]
MAERKGRRTVVKAFRYSRKALANWVMEICKAPVAEQQRSADEVHLGQRLLQVKEALSAKFIKIEDADDNTYAPLQPSRATQRRQEKAATRKARVEADLVFAEEERERARQRTARYRARQAWGKRAKVSSRHSGKSGFVPLPDERIWAKRRQVLLAGGTWGDEEEEEPRKTWAGRVERAKAEELEQFGSLLDPAADTAEAS